MFTKKIAKFVKNDGSLAHFDRNKIVSSIAKACLFTRRDPKIANLIISDIEKLLFKKHKGRLPTCEHLQAAVEEVLLKKGYKDVAEAYVSYKEKRNEIRKTHTRSVHEELKLNLTSLKILQDHYLLKNDAGVVFERPLDLFKRVSHVVARVDGVYGLDAILSEKEFFEFLSSLTFLPNSSCLMHAGTKVQHLSTEFVLDVPDSLDAIFETLKTAALLEKTGESTSFNFSLLRPKGALIESTKEISSGPLSFLSLFDKMTDVLKEGRKRKGINRAVLRIDHPDILAFVSASHEFTHFTFSVALTDVFMRAVLQNKDYVLLDPVTKKVVKELSAQHVFDLLITSGLNFSQPSLFFLDRTNALSSSDESLIALSASEGQPLLGFESCASGNLNLAKFVLDKDVDYVKLKKAVHLAVRFLDNLIDAQDYVSKEIEEVTKLNRRISLGVMGWAELLILLGISYNSNEALKLANSLMKFIATEARNCSTQLGMQRGSFPTFKKSKLVTFYSHARNLTLTGISSSDTLSLLAHSCSSGIEPLFSLHGVREILKDTKIIQTHPLFETYAKHQGIYSAILLKDLLEVHSLKTLSYVPLSLKHLFITTSDVNVPWQLTMQATFQKYVDGNVSNLIYLPTTASKKDVKDAYLLAYKLGCKSVTLFKLGSKKG